MSNFAAANVTIQAEALNAAKMRDHYRGLVNRINAKRSRFTAAEFRDANEELEFWGNRLAFLETRNPSAVFGK
jgi:hypothetical protein